MRTLRVPMNVADHAARMLEYVHSAFTKLESVGYGNFAEVNPEKSIKLIQGKLYPKRLKDSMQELLEFQEGLKKNLQKYVELLCEEAIVQEKILVAQRKKNLARNDQDYNQNKSFKAKENSDNRLKSSNKKGKSFLCLNPACKTKDIYHVGGVRHCPITSKEEVSQLLKEYTKSRKYSKKVTASTKIVDKNSTMIDARFAGVVGVTICGDGGSDINLLPPDVFEELIEKRAKMRVTSLDKPQKFSLAASDQYVSCHKEVEMNTELHIRHGKSLMIRNLRWFVAIENVEEPLLGRPIREALGFNAKEILAAARDKFKGEVNPTDILSGETYPDGSTACILPTGMFRSDLAMLPHTWEHLAHL